MTKPSDNAGTLPWALRMVLSGRHIKRPVFADGVTLAIHKNALWLHQLGAPLPDKASGWGYVLRADDIKAKDWGLSNC